MHEPINPRTIIAPVGPYSHGVLSRTPGRMLQIAGQIGVDADGRLGETFADQARLAWQNICAILEAAGMSVADLTKVTTYVTAMTDLPELGPIRQRFLGDARPASTVVEVRALVRPDWKIEIDAVACQADPGR